MRVATDSPAGNCLLQWLAGGFEVVDAGSGHDVLSKGLDVQPACLRVRPNASQEARDFRLTFDIGMSSGTIH